MIHHNQTIIAVRENSEVVIIYPEHIMILPMVLQICQQIQLHETKCQGATGGQTTIVTPPYQKVGPPSYEVAEQNPVTTSSYKMLEVPWVLEMFSHNCHL
jgi:hypothetical protein